MGPGQTILTLLIALTLNTCVPFSGWAATPAAPKAFAVFVAYYNTHNDEARGGVAGSLFFVSPTEAITAYHVLQPASFTKRPGFERMKVWLVHAGEPAIEVKPEYLTYQPDKDLTFIRLPKSAAVRPHFVYATAAAAQGAAVETEGYIAGSTGPVFVRQGEDLAIAAVPQLQMLRLNGKVLRQAQVEVVAADLKVKNSPNVELSYRPVVGMSGGPVVSEGRVIAMNSFADPATRLSTWALQIKPVSQPLLNP